MYIETWEFEGLQEMEKCNARVFGAKEMKRIQAEFHTLIDNSTFARFIWNSVRRLSEHTQPRQPSTVKTQ